jgi:hypothetical protein
MLAINELGHAFLGHPGAKIGHTGNKLHIRVDGTDGVQAHEVLARYREKVVHFADASAPVIAWETIKEIAPGRLIRA